MSTIASLACRARSRVVHLATLVVMRMAVLIVAVPVSAQSTVIGTVYVDSTNRPVRNAEVTIASLGKSVRADSAGNFTLRDIPAGLQFLTIRALGYEPQTQRLPLRDGQVLESDFYLRRSIQQLAAVDVSAKAAEAMPMRMKMAGFEDRQKLGFGRFLTREDFEKAEGRPLGDVIVRRVPGLRFFYPPGSTRRFLVSNRVTSKKAPQCYVRVYVDGLLFNPGGLPFDPDTVDPSTLAGLEFHNLASTPLQYNRTDGPPCGTLLLWTR
jgi:hypothetical protein